MATCVTVPMGPACVNLTGIRAGDKNQMTGTVTMKGDPVDLTGQSISAQARKRSTDVEVALSAVVTITDAAEGKFTMRWPGDDVAVLLADKATWSGVWDLQLDGVAYDELSNDLSWSGTVVLLRHVFGG